MRITLYGTSAFSLLATIRERPSPSPMPARDIVGGSSANAHSLRYLHERLPQLPDPLHLAADAWAGAPQPNRRIHRTKCRPDDPLAQVDHGIYAPSPELCFLQLAGGLPLLETVMLGSALCGTFALDPRQPSGLAERPPLTSVADIGAFLDTRMGQKGVARARRALGFIADGAASPPEVFLRMALTLPARHGGFGLEGSVSNEPITLSKRAQRYTGKERLIPDLLWPDSKLVVEYDSNAEHLTGPQVTSDAKRRMALETDGYTVITVTTQQIAAAQTMKNVAEEVCRRRGRRYRIRSQRFEQGQAELFSLRWSLNDRIDATWARRMREEGRAATAELAASNRRRW